jgi:serine/threonine protein kinase/tetratricopeptide (TPR) repeat protein
LIGSRLGPYEITAKLGHGGMGEVYRATDTRLERDVAIKVLPPAFAADSARLARFKREAQTLAALNHPNIAHIYELAEGALVMELVEGDDLSLLIARGALPLAEALPIARQIAEALESAHEQGIVHRDLKPANVKVRADGAVKVLDFGLAKAMDNRVAPSADPGDSPTLTAPGTKLGMVLGTAAYMAPEQARGKSVDKRADIWAFGAVLYEMLSGARAFKGDETLEVLAAVLRQDIDWTALPPETPVRIRRLLSRCLDRDVKHRLRDIGEARVAIAEELAAPGEVASSAAGTDHDVQSIAVLPFVNLSADMGNEYFSDGLAEEIINALTKVTDLRVIARTSAFAFRGREQDLRTIGARLRVGTLLEGSVRTAGNRIRVGVQLIKVADESHLWSERYDREMTDVFALQDEISQAVANALKVKLSPPRRQTGDIEAFQSYLQGLYWYQRYTPESLSRAQESFERALECDPGYAHAHAGLAVFYYGLGALGSKRMNEMATLAKAAAERALAIDETLSEAHAVLGVVAGAVEYDWEQAERHFQRAMAVDPIPPLVRVRYALYYLTPLRRFEEAVEQYQRALETDPLSMMVHFGLAFALYCQRRYRSAVEHARRAVDLYPDYWLVHFAMGLALSRDGSLQQAIASFETTVRLSPSFAHAAGFLASAYAEAGERDRAEKLMEETRERGRRAFVSPAVFAIYHAALGQAERMFEDLDAALAERDPYLTRMDAEPLFEPFRSDPRYRGLLARMKLDGSR